MKAWSAALLLAMLCAAVLLAWIPERWPASVLEAGSFTLALAWVVKLAVSGERPRSSPLLLPVAFIAMWGMLQIALGWTATMSETVRATLGWSANLAILFIAVQTFDNPYRRDQFLRALLWFGIGLSVLAILQSFTSNGRVFWVFRVSDPTFVMGPFVYHNHYAAFIEALLPLALIAALEERRMRLWFAFGAATMIASVIVSASRSGFILVLLETVAVVGLVQWRHRRAGRRMLPALAIILAATAVLTVMAGWDALAIRLMEQHAYFDRLQMLRSSLDMFRDHAWAGVGLGNWPIVFPSYARYDDGLFANQAHNDWAQAAAEGGVAVLLAFAALFVWTVRAAAGNVWAVGLVVIFVHAFFDYPFHKPQIAGIVFAMLGAATAATTARSNGEASRRRDAHAAGTAYRSPE